MLISLKKYLDEDGSTADPAAGDTAAACRDAAELDRSAPDAGHTGAALNTSPAPRPSQTTLLGMIQLLLQGIERFTIKGEEAEYESFRSTVREVQQRLDPPPPDARAMALAKATVRALEEYNTSTGKLLSVQCSELQAMVAMLTKTMGSIASGGESAVARLNEIEQQIRSASMVEDFQTAKARMSECLTHLNAEIRRQREQSAQTASELKDVLDKSQERRAAVLRTISRTDPVTGLLDRRAAEGALAAALEENRKAFVVIFLVERVDLINSRFGHAVGDRVLQIYARHLRQSLPPTDKLFRWTGPALLAILDRRGTLQYVWQEIRRTVSRRMTETVEVGGRPVLLPIAAAWTALSLAETRPLENLIQQIEACVHNTSQGSEEEEADRVAASASHGGRKFFPPE